MEWTWFGRWLRVAEFFNGEKLNSVWEKSDWERLNFLMVKNWIWFQRRNGSGNGFFLFFLMEKDAVEQGAVEGEARSLRKCVEECTIAWEKWENM